MNLTHIFASYDRQAQYYLAPFNCRSETEAVRAFTEAVMTSETPLAQYPADFDLVHVGTFDMDTGLLAGIGMPRLILNGLAALQAAQASRSRYESTLKPRFDPAVDQSDNSSLSA